MELQTLLNWASYFEILTEILSLVHEILYFTNTDARKYLIS